MRPKNEAMRIGVEAGVGECLDASSIGLDFVLAGEIDLALHQQALATQQDRTGGIAGTGAGARGDGTEQDERHQRCVLLGGLERALQMVLRDMPDFVGNHAGQLAFAVGDDDQAGIDHDIATRRRKGVDDRIFCDGKDEVILGLLAAGDQAIAEVVDVVVQHRVVHHHVQRPHLPQHGGAVILCFLR